MKFSRVIAAFLSGSIKGHFGQWGEDVLIRKLFDRKLSDGFYLDLGAYHPFTHSNTAYFWIKGWSGINVDANPYTIDLFNKTRPNDQNIWAAIIPHSEYEKGTREVSLLTSNISNSSAGVSTTGTVLQSVADQRGFTRKIKVPAKSISIITQECGLKKLDYLNIDVEGLDETVLTELDIERLAPHVISVEDYSIGSFDLFNSKISRIIDEQGYIFVARAGPTSIFQKNIF